MKIKKIGGGVRSGVGVGVVGWGGVEGQGGCERKIEVFVKIQFFFWWGEGVQDGRGRVGGGSGWM